jgi:hypothetical protein
VGPQPIRGRQPGDAGADHDDVGVERRHRRRAVMRSTAAELRA